MADIWDELGIAPTDDRGAVRRAYAARLKTAAPDADPQGFARLRQAYEQALAAAETTVETASPVQQRAATSAREPPASPAAVQPDGVADHLLRGDVLAAAEWLLAARPNLTLQRDLRLTDRLGWAMAQDARLPGDAVRDAAGRLGWLHGEAAGAWAAQLRARLDAEQWLAALERDAASGTRLVAGARAVSARILLGRGRMRALGILGNDRTLRRRYGEYLLHVGVVGDRFDQARIEAVGLALTARPDKPRSPLTMLLGIAVIAWALGSVAGWIDPDAQDTVSGVVATGLFAVLFGRGLVRRVGRLWKRTAG